MGDLINFIRECGPFFVITLNGDSPAGRPFGAIAERDGILYIATGASKSVYRQLVANPVMQIVAIKPGSRSWVRVSGHAFECCDIAVKEMMFEDCPVLQKRYSGVCDPNLAVFGVTVDRIERFE